MRNIIFTLAVCATAAHAALLVDVPVGGSSGPTIGGPTNQYLASRWTQDGTAQNVTVLVNLFTGGVTPPSNRPVDAWITNQTGPGTPAGSALAHVSINAPIASSWVTLFSNLTLGPGTWNVILSSPLTENYIGWHNGNQTVTTEPGITFLGNKLSAGAASNTANPIASNFAGSYPSLAISVRGNFEPADTPTPEPASLALTGCALLAAGWLKRNRS